MIARLALLMLLLPAIAVAGPVVSAVGDTVVVARPGTIERFEARTLRSRGSSPSVEHPHAIALAGDGRRAAVLDSIEGRVAVVDLIEGTTRFIEAVDSPVAASWSGDAVYVISRGDRSLRRITPGGRELRIEVAADPAFLVARPSSVWVYGRIDGTIERFDPVSLARLATGRTEPFAADLEADSRFAYLAIPRSGILAVVSLDTLETTGRRPAGAVPSDLAITSAADMLTASSIAIADPSSKRVWREEGSQSVAQAAARGFLRGLLGLGLYSPRSTEFPTGVDRVFERDGELFAFDSSSGSLYEVHPKKSRRLATGLAWGEFALAARRVIQWNAARSMLIASPTR